MRQALWDIATGNTTIDWPDNVTLPGQACEQLGYQLETSVGGAGISLAVYQWPQKAAHSDPTRTGNERRYLIVLTLAAGYEIIGARDLKGLLLALKTLEPLSTILSASATWNEPQA
jgi:hypothetical protein